MYVAVLFITIRFAKDMSEASMCTRQNAIEYDEAFFKALLYSEVKWRHHERQSVAAAHKMTLESGKRKNPPKRGTVKVSDGVVTDM